MNRNTFTAALFVLVVLIWALAARAEITISQPDGPVETGDQVQLFVSGLPESALPKAKVTHWPREKTVLVPARTWGGDPFIWFSAKQPASYLISVAAAVDGELEYAEAIVDVGGVQPEPEPDPDPIPPPPGPLAELWAIVVEETKDRTLEQARVLLSPTLRKWMRANGHNLRIVDKDQPATDLQEWIDRATAPEASALPYLFLCGDSGEVVFEGPLPNTPAAMLELAKKWGAEK